jgi:hypothetical protein
LLAPTSYREPGNRDLAEVFGPGDRALKSKRGATMLKRICQVLLLAGMVGPAGAAVLQVDADSVGFFINPDPNYSVAVDLSGSPILYTPGDTLAIDIEFVDLDGSDGHGVGASQFLQIFDLTQQVGADPDPPQDINVFLNSAGAPSALANMAFQIMFTGVSGTISGTTFAGAAPFCNPGFYCASGATGADLIPAPPGQDASFLYHDFHITFSSDADSSIPPFNITSLSFGGAADQVGVVTVPEPATLALIGIGIAGIGYQRRKRSKT